MKKRNRIMSVVWAVLASVLLTTQLCCSKNDPRTEEETPVDYTAQYATVAPYFRSTLTTANYEEMLHNTAQVKDIAEKLAEALGVKITCVYTNAGLYQGGAELSYTYLLSEADQETADLFAALMGDLSFEYQDAVIAYNYVADDDTTATAIELLYTLPSDATIESITTDLNEVGSDGTACFDENELQIISFGEEDCEKIVVAMAKKSAYTLESRHPQNSRYLENADRQQLYARAIERYKDDVTLYAACSMALAICRATEGVAEEERLAAAREAAKKWDEEHPFTL